MCQISWRKGHTASRNTQLISQTTRSKPQTTSLECNEEQQIASTTPSAKRNFLIFVLTFQPCIRNSISTLRMNLIFALASSTVRDDRKY